MAFTPAPPVPDRADKATFPSRMYNMWVWFVATIAELSTLGSFYNLSTSTTSSTSNNITTGSKTFTVPAGLGFVPGMSLRIANTASPTNYGNATVTTYSGTSLQVTFDTVNGSGSSITTWSISLAATSVGASLASNIFTGLQRWFAGANIASAATVDLTAATGNTINITGTTATSAFTITGGQLMQLIAPAGWPLTYNATTCNITGGADYKCAAGDRVWVFKDVSGVVYVNVTKQDGTPVVAPTIPIARQTVMVGPVDTNGLPSFGGSTGSTTVTASGTLIVTAANSLLNRIGSIINPSWTGLNTNGVMYLYLDIASDGTCTTGATTLQPTYRDGGADVITNGQFTFNINEMIGKVGNGSVANQAYRVFVGEVTVAAAVVSAIVWYALNGKYRQPLSATLPGTSTVTNVAHNIGVTPRNANVALVCKTTENGFAVGDVWQDATTQISGSATVKVTPISTYKQSTFLTANGNAFIILNKTTPAGAVIPTAANWYYQLTADRGF